MFIYSTLLGGCDISFIKRKIACCDQLMLLLLFIIDSEKSALKGERIGTNIRILKLIV